MYTTITGVGTQTEEGAGNKVATNYVFKQSHDLNASSIKNFVPIAGASTSSSLEKYTTVLYTWFGGTYDGQSYKIQELNITSKSFTVGLFGVTVGADIKNTILYSTNNAKITRETANTDPDGAYSLGGLIGVAYNYNGASGTREITNCAIAGYTIVDNSKNRLTLGEANVGGLIGVANVNVNKCSSVVDIEINCTHYDSGGNFTRSIWGNFIRVGGIAGAVQNIVQNSYSGGSITVNGVVLNETYSSAYGKYSSTGLVATNSTDSANYDASTHIFLSGIAGSGFTMNYQNFTGNSDIKDGNPKVENCYTYMTFPKMEGTIRSITMFASIADRYAQGSVDGVTIDNCYYFDRSAEIDISNLPSYNFGGSSAKESMDKTYLQSMLNGSAKWMYQIFKNVSYWNASDKGTFTNVDSKTYAELSFNDMCTTLGPAFASVTNTDEKGIKVAGKYSFNAGTISLEGKDYPFPTVIRQDDDATKVHYGSWPFAGAYWEKGVDTLDIFDSMSSDGWAYKDIKLISNGTIFGNSLEISVSDATPYVQIVDNSLKQDADGNYVLQVKALKTGTTRITATWDGGSAEFLLTVTANLSVSADPNEMTLAKDESKVSSLKAVSSTNINYSNNKNLTWSYTASTDVKNDGDVGVTGSGNKVTITGTNLNAEVQASATYNYNGEKYTASTIITVWKNGVIGFGKKDDTESKYNEGAYPAQTDTVNGSDATYSSVYAPMNDSKYFVYEVNADTFLEDTETTYSFTFEDFKDSNGNTYNVENIQYNKEINKSDITTNTNDFKTIPLGNFYYITSDLNETRTVDIILTINNGDKTYILTLDDVTIDGRPYQLTLDADGGKFNNNSSTKTSNITEDIIISDFEEPTRTGYTFSSWIYEDETEATDIALNDVTSDITLYAKWVAKIGYINFVSQDVIVKENVEVAYDSSEIEQYPKDQYPTRTGYKFAGWYTDTTYTTQVIDKDGNVTGSEALNNMILSDTTQTLYAKWNRRFKLAYDLGSGNTPDSVTKVNEDSVSFSKPAELDSYTELEGYTFLGWYYWNDETGDNVTQVTDENGDYISGAEIDGAIKDGKFNVSDTAEDITITLHAKWGIFENVTGYFEVSSLTNGSSYIIVNDDNDKALKNNNNNISSSDVTVTVKITESGNADYISSDVDTSIKWTYDNSNRLVNNNRYLRRNISNNLSISSNSSSWSYSDNQLTTTSRRTTYYINYNNGFGLNTNSSKVHIYSEVTRKIQVPTWIYQ